MIDGTCAVFVLFFFSILSLWYYGLWMLSLSWIPVNLKNTFWIVKQQWDMWLKLISKFSFLSFALNICYFQHFVQIKCYIFIQLKSWRMSSPRISFNKPKHKKLVDYIIVNANLFKPFVDVSSIFFKFWDFWC